MGKKQLNTPRSFTRSMVRQLWMKSRERAKALKDAGYCCTICGVKQSMAKGRVVKLQVHHDPPIGDKWEEIIDLIAKVILEAPQYPLCAPCHEKETKRKANYGSAKGNAHGKNSKKTKSTVICNG